MEYLQKILTTIGGATVIVAVVLTFLKSIVEKYIDSLIGKSANKELERVKNKLSRSMSAYELLLNKEFSYYQNIDVIYASLIVDVQDIYWNMVEAKEVDIVQRCSNTKDISLRVIKSIPELKNKTLMYQCYLPSDVYNSISNVIMCMQKDLDQLIRSIHMFYEKKDFDEIILKNYIDNVLMSIALSNTKIKERLDKLSS